MRGTYSIDPRERNERVLRHRVQSVGRSVPLSTGRIALSLSEVSRKTRSRQHVPVAVSARTEIAAVADHSERESSSYRYKHVPLIFQVNIPADHEVALRQQDIHVDVLPVHHFIPASENECSGGELYGFSGWHCQTRSFLRARTCGLQSLRLLSFRAIVVSSHLLYATLQMQKVPRG
ncbi:uncharacterized protein LOC143901744 isoform X1 [Temnothorax americanus]|uniref:uncharacterized protein LOC143901744 isoform X1 n=1 Tax=Temnothorax americanus TaxID=1964332 RepID=UPI0040688901